MLTFILILVVYLSGVAVQYVRINTVHKEWADDYRKSLDWTEDNILIPLAIGFSWIAFIFMWTKNFLDQKIKNYQK